jgi:hypothetical protein
MLACALFLLTFALSTALGSAQQHVPKPGSATRSFRGFVVNLTLSTKAKAIMVERNETVIVAGYFYGFPKKGTRRKYIDDMGEVWVGKNIQAELRPGENATFGEIKLDSRGLERVDENGPQLLINVFSGRRSSKDNLLSCGIYEGPLEKIEGGNIPISCKMITEEYPEFKPHN